MRFLFAGGITALLVVFLIVTRWIEPGHDTLIIRTAQGIDPVAMPVPLTPPPQAESQPTPPPPPAVTMDIPKLELSLNHAAPPIRAMMAESQLDVKLKPAEFATAQPQKKASNLYTPSQLDSHPSLLNRPKVTFPASLTRAGVKQGKVVLEVMINMAGTVHVKRAISSTHPELIPMAKTFAAKARFSPPKKDGRNVNALFNWPLILRP